MQTFLNNHSGGDPGGENPLLDTSIHTPRATSVDQALSLDRAREIVKRMQESLKAHLVGLEEQIRLAVPALIAPDGQHLLFVGPAGCGKSALAQALPQVIGLSYSSVHGSADLTPGDLIGCQVPVKTGDSIDLVLMPGPALDQGKLVLKLDEVNRLNDKTQGALLGLMRDQQIPIGSAMVEVPSGLLVIGTMNPYGVNQGNFQLIDPVLDRFSGMLEFTNPSADSLRMAGVNKLLKNITPDRIESVLTRDEDPIRSLLAIREFVSQVEISETLISKGAALVSELSCSFRAFSDLIRQAQGRAFVLGREYVIGEDLAKVALITLPHRIPENEETLISSQSPRDRVLNAQAMNELYNRTLG